MIDSTLKNGNILIVDDQQANIDLLTGLLDAKGFTNYASITDPRQVISLFKENKPDLILLDLNMPYLTGFQVMLQLKDLIPANTYFPILVLTADITPESKQKALAGGASDFLTKPFDLIEVDLRIKNLLNTRCRHQKLENQNQSLEEKVKERTKELEKINIELTAAKEKAEESDKLKSEFLAQMSHEIRTPLSTILGNVEYLSESFINKMDPEDRDCLKSINQASNRIIRTVELILNIAELQTGCYKPIFVTIDLKSEILDQLFHEYRLTAKQQELEFIFTCKEKDTTVIADKYSITKVFANLIDNALKYTKKGKVKILMEKNKMGNLEVQVKDTGIGISKQFLQKIFEPFTQEEQGYTRSFEGNGLGLTLVKKYCELNNVVIEVDSEKKIGSTFKTIFDNKFTGK